MKIIVTGSLGNISKPLTEELVEKGHLVTVISRKPEKQKDIESLGARAAIGYVEDVKFLSTTFTGADAVYCMEPPYNHDAEKLIHNYVQAIQQSGVKRLVNLSSIGAHTDKGNGILAFYYTMETILNKLPSDVAITFVRPGGFYYNLLRCIDTIKTQGVIASNYGGDDKLPWASPIDIAAAVAEELVTPFAGRKVCYVVSDELTCDEVATILGTAIGKPDLKWIVIPDEEMRSRLIAAGFSARLAAGFVEMNASTHSGQLFEDYYRNRPLLGKVKMKDFAQEFASIYDQK
jgi:uncharacterized protein YbjT (DUF2867 family)